MSNPDDTNDCGCSRRSVLKAGATVLGCLAIGVDLVGCGSLGSNVSPFTVKLADYPSLNNVGGTALIPTSVSGANYPIYVHRSSASQYLAFNSACPHAGCEVSPSGNGYFCPCHGSSFNEQGKAVSGPARGKLQSYKVQVSSDTLTIS